MQPKARRDGLLTRTVGDDLVVYDQQDHRVHGLNRTAALVWRHCDGRTSVAELARIIRDEAQRPVDEAVVYTALDELAEAGLLEEPVEAPAGKRLTRKQILLVAAGIGLLAPAVESIVAPDKAAALSI